MPYWPRPEADLASSAAIGQTTIDLANIRHGPIRPHDVIEIIDRYPGSQALDFSTIDTAYVTDINGSAYTVQPLGGGALRAHPADAQVRVISVFLTRYD